LTPFVGAGVGVAYNTLDDFVDIGVQRPAAGSAATAAISILPGLQAGVSYAVTQNFSVELAYRYLNYGSVTDTIDCTGAATPTLQVTESQLERLDAGRALAFPGWIRTAAVPAAISACEPRLIIATRNILGNANGAGNRAVFIWRRSNPARNLHLPPHRQVRN